MNKDEIEIYLHCRDCILSKPKNITAEKYSDLNIGRTAYGILIWCSRHEKEVAHFPFDWKQVDAIKKCECENCKR